MTQQTTFGIKSSKCKQCWCTDKIW